MSLLKIILPFACLLWASPAMAHDLTAGDAPTSGVHTNMGPTGFRGWIDHSGYSTNKGRQILVTDIYANSPAAGLLQVGDVILGADGTGATPVNFTSNARHRLADAINDAEARDPAELKLLRWRNINDSGVIDVVTLTLRYMGAYSDTAPYNCPKSAKILEEALQYIAGDENTPGQQADGRSQFDALALLAANDPSNPKNAVRMSRAQNQARSLVPWSELSNMLDLDAPSIYSPWHSGHALIVLAEYYLLTGDSDVLPGIEAFAVNIAKGQGMLGTVGHYFVTGERSGTHQSPMNSGNYGAVNSAALPCAYGLILARQAGIDHEVVNEGIARSANYFAYYSEKSNIPYGEHIMERANSHTSNGKSGGAALFFNLLPDRGSEELFFSKMSVASHDAREGGHSGPYFNYVWSPLGAAIGGEEAAAAYFKRTRWHYDLSRHHDGSFTFESMENNNRVGGTYHNFPMSTATLLTYALPLRQLHCTGRNQDLSNPLLSSADVTEAVNSAGYTANISARPLLSDLVDDLQRWSPVIRGAAAFEFRNRTVDATTVDAVTAIANDPSYPANVRYAACYALGLMVDETSASARLTTLADLLSDPDGFVRTGAGYGLIKFGRGVSKKRNQILAAAINSERPFDPLNDPDPMQVSSAPLATVLFDKWTGVIRAGIDSMPRPELYEAVRVLSKHPHADARGRISEIYERMNESDFYALSGSIVDLAAEQAPANTKYGVHIRIAALNKMASHNIAEAVPAAMAFIKQDLLAGTQGHPLGVLATIGAPAVTVDPDPGVVEHMKYLMQINLNAGRARNVLDAIASNPSPTPLTPLKEIYSITPSASSIQLPATQMTLEVDAYDHAQGDSIYSWRKVRGAGEVSFLPNHTAESEITTAQFDGTPGNYLFEVTMLDSRNFTVVRETVEVTLFDSAGELPPNAPPVPDDQTLTSERLVPLNITLSGSDPENYALLYRILNKPNQGFLTGVAPNVTYMSYPSVTEEVDHFTFEVIDSEGQTAIGTITLNLNINSTSNAVVHESFDLPTRHIHGTPGGKGLSGNWSSNSDTNNRINPGSLPFARLARYGNHFQSNHSGTSSIRLDDTLSASGLLQNGATLWLSALVRWETTNTNSGWAISLGTDTLSSLNNVPMNNSGAGVGFLVHRGQAIRPAYWSEGAMKAQLFDTDSAGTNQTHFVVLKIQWGATDSDDEIITLYRPESNLLLPTPRTTYSAPAMNQSEFRFVSLGYRASDIRFDELRIGATYEDVIGRGGFTPDHENWAAQYGNNNLLDPYADTDGDGLSNQFERIWGFDPLSKVKENHYGRLLDPSTGTFTYKRRSKSMTGANFVIWTSPDLKTWTAATDATQQPGPPNADGVETVEVRLAPELLGHDTLFYKVEAK